ncbi:MAG: hypothetical protein MUF36_01715 [Bacteroidales bacterium]|jgi:hypothetical protein|nr:hypothetical protein [Bacteroidales bacterium]
MKELLKKLNYKGQLRIAVLNAEESFYKAVAKELKGVITDDDIDQRCPYGFMILFVKTVADVNQMVPVALHNLTADGILWFCYPKKTSKKYKSDLERDKGWKVLNDAGFYGIRMVSIDDDWSAMRFRNIRFIKLTSGRFPKQ